MIFFKREGRKISLVLCAALFILLTLTGCQQKEQQNDGFMDGDRVASFEALYGQDKASVLKELGLKEDDVSQEESQGMWNLKEPVSFEGKEFSKSLLYDVSAETFYGMQYLYHSDDETEITELVENLLKEGSDLYGESSTYPGLQNRLTAEEFTEDFSKAMAEGNAADWREEWTVGEKTLCTLSVMVAETNSAAVILQYAPAG